MRTWSRNPGAGNRARYELTRDPARSDEVIAPAARCTPQTVHAIRRELEDAGDIPRVPVSDRAPRKRPVPPSRTRDAIARLGPDATPRQVADLAVVTIQMAWRELTAQRAAPRTLPAHLAGGRCASASVRLWDSADPADRELAALVCTRECPAAERVPDLVGAERARRRHLGRVHR